MKKLFLLSIVVLFLGSVNVFAQQVVFKLDYKSACTDNPNSYVFRVYENGSKVDRIYVSLGSDGYWYKDCAGTLDGEMISDSRNVSVNKAVELLWNEYLNHSASSVTIDWEED